MLDNVTREIQRLQNLLAGKLTELEQTELNRQLVDLQKTAEANQRNYSKRRPSKVPWIPPLRSPTVIEGQVANNEVVSADDSAPSPSPKSSAEPSSRFGVVELVPLASPRPEQGVQTDVDIPVLVYEIKETVDYVLFLRAAWATTLSPDIDRQAEAWLGHLQRLGAKLKAIDAEALEFAMDGHSYVLTAPIHATSKPKISESLQERMMAPSMPGSGKPWLSELYYIQHESRNPPPPQPQPEGYLPDGLQSLVS